MTKQRVWRLAWIAVMLAALVLAGCGGGGNDGSMGPEGMAGLQGPQGEMGAAGADGMDGAAGSKGDSGEMGAAGADGMDGAAGPKGDSGEMGAKGDKGDSGEMGAKGDKGDPGEDVDADTLANLIARITALEGDKADKPDPVGLPTVDGAMVLTRDTMVLSQVAATYDTTKLTITAATGSTAKNGSYDGAAMIGFGGLDVTDAGSTGAGIRGGWLEYGHWGIITTKDKEIAVFSVGMPMPAGANPAPASAAQMKATWTGGMVGLWDPDEADDAAELLPNMNVRGKAMITVGFATTAAGVTSSADLMIYGLSSNLGTFRTGDAINVNADGLERPLEADEQSTLVWAGMKITAGDFSRRSFTGGTLDLTDDDPLVPTDKSYLAGSFYGMDGMEVGGVFMETGEVSGTDNVFGVPATQLGATAADQEGILTGAFGAARDIP